MSKCEYSHRMGLIKLYEPDNPFVFPITILVPADYRFFPAEAYENLTPELTTGFDRKDLSFFKYASSLRESRVSIVPILRIAD